MRLKEYHTKVQGGKKSEMRGDNRGLEGEEEVQAKGCMGSLT